jgi:hypothetical protein
MVVVRRMKMIINGVHMNTQGKRVDRFDLEQGIMEAWHIVDDLKLLVNRLEYMDEDQVFCALHGIEIFADMRFEELWKTFENCVSNGEFNDNNRRADEIAKALDEAPQGFGQEKI